MKAARGSSARRSMRATSWLWSAAPSLPVMLATSTRQPSSGPSHFVSTSRMAARTRSLAQLSLGSDFTPHQLS
jgi:hypothetical protein